VTLVDLPSKTLSATVGGLHPGQSSNRHRHNYETIIVILKGRGRSVIEDRVVEWTTGDALYVPVWAWHHHENASADESCQYLACENAPLLQNLGGIALREEWSDALAAAAAPSADVPEPRIGATREVRP
jgi:gentisate 1,2-dioxygenase